MALRSRFYRRRRMGRSYRRRPFAAIPEGVEAGMVVAVTTADVIVVAAVLGLAPMTRSVMW